MPEADHQQTREVSLQELHLAHRTALETGDQAAAKAFEAQIVEIQGQILSVAETH